MYRYIIIILIALVAWFIWKSQEKPKNTPAPGINNPKIPAPGDSTKYNPPGGGTPKPNPGGGNTGSPFDDLNPTEKPV